MKKNEGITLIALIITIIILIILTAVTINNVIGTDLIGFATKAVENYVEAGQREGNILNGILNGNGTEETRTPVTLTDDDIGKYVNYKPNGEDYTVSAHGSGLDQIPEDTRNDLEQQMKNKEQVFSPDPNMKWRLCKFDSENIVLIGSKPTEQELYLYGKNYSPSEIDKICSANYGGFHPDAKSFSVSAEALGFEGLEWKNILPDATSLFWHGSTSWLSEQTKEPYKLRDSYYQWRITDEQMLSDYWMYRPSNYTGSLYCERLTPMVSIPRDVFDLCVSDEPGMDYDIYIDFNAIHMERIGEDEYFIFDAESGSIALEPVYGYYSRSDDKYKVEVPAEYEGHTVTKIGINRERSVQMELMSKKDEFWPNGLGFYSASNVFEVVLPDTITEIEDYAFANCVSLCRINIPKSVKKIGKNAFASCASLGEVLVPEGAEIEENAFDVVTKVTKY